MDEMSLVMAHVSHDGWPEKLVDFGSNPQTVELAIVLAACHRSSSVWVKLCGH